MKKAQRSLYGLVHLFPGRRIYSRFSLLYSFIWQIKITLVGPPWQQHWRQRRNERVSGQCQVNDVALPPVESARIFPRDTAMIYASLYNRKGFCVYIDTNNRLLAYICVYAHYAVCVRVCVLFFNLFPAAVETTMTMTTQGIMWDSRKLAAKCFICNTFCIHVHCTIDIHHELGECFRVNFIRKYVL